MGKGKKVTVSFWYKLIVLLGWCKGPIDALLEIRGGDRVAWSGRQETDGIINVDKPDLYGGETAEGGIQGQFEVMMGTSDQAPNAYLTEHFGDHQPGRRGKSMVLLRGPKIGAGNPYPKPLYFKLERILKGWDDDVCWYPEKARVGGEGFSIGAGSWWLTGMSPGQLWVGNDPSDFSDAVEVTRDPNAGIGGHGSGAGGYYRVNESMAMLFGVGGGVGEYELIFDGLAITDGTVAPVVATLPGEAGEGTALNIAVFDGVVFLMIASTGRTVYWTFDSAEYAGSGPVTWVEHTPPGGLRLVDIDKAGGNFICAVRTSSSAALYYSTDVRIPTTWQAATLSSGNYPNMGDKFLSLPGQEAVIFRGTQVMRTDDEGLSWFLSANALPSGLGNAAASAHNGSGVIVVGDVNATAVCRSDDNGDTWALIPGLSPRFGMIKFYGSRFVGSAPGSDGGIWTAPADGLTWTQSDLPGGVSPGFYTNLHMAPVATLGSGALGMMNPAHVIYDAITSRRENGGMGEPVGRVNDASFRAAADLFYNEVFGVCCTWYGGESAEQFIERICTVAGVTLSQSSVDGMYYLFPLREVADPETLFTLTDDDIIEFEAEPALPPESINQMQVKWFDPMTREERITAPVQALGAIEDAGGVIPEVREYYEIPYEELALRVADRDLRSFSSALWRLRLTCTSRVYGLQKGMQIRVMAPLRGFADMIVVVGDVDEGTLTEQEISLVLLQDVFSLPDASFVEAQPPLAPPTIGDPVNIADVVAIESPYVELAASMREADLQLVGEETGFLVVGAVQPGNGTQYQLATKAAGEEYETYGNGDWTPSATIVEEDVLLDGPPATEFTFDAGTLLDRVEVGTWALWGGEMCRVDALDIGAGTLTLGRAVGDTVPQPHAASSKIYFIGDWYSTDQREYVDTEVVTAKAQNRTGQGLIALDTAPSASTTMAGRQVRPYPPANVTINGEYYPASGDGDVVLLWAHRDRELQADQLIPWQGATVEKELGQVYNARLYKDDVLVEEELALDADTFTFTDPGTGTLRVEIESERDGFVSWQMFSHEMDWGAVGALVFDPFFRSVTSLLHFDGADTSTNIVDSAGRVWAVSGQAQIDTAQSVFGGASLYLDGATDYLTATSSPDLALGTGDFTVEFWQRWAGGKNISPIDFRGGTASSPRLMLYADSPANDLRLWVSGADRIVAPSSTLVVDQWQHIAICRASGTTRLFVGGVQVGSDWADSTNYTAADWAIGRNTATGTRDFNGHIDEFRATKGVARYTGAFTPPVAALPDFTPYDAHYANVSSLLLPSGADAATVAYDCKGPTWTFAGNAQIDTGITHLGRPMLLLDGSGDFGYLADSDNFHFADGDFCLEIDVRFASLPSNSTVSLLAQWRIGSGASRSWFLAINDVSGTKNFRFLVSTDGSSSTNIINDPITLSTGVVYRFRVSREGTVVRAFLDDVQVGADYDIGTTSLFNSTDPIRVGSSGNSGSSENYLNGSVAGVRITKGASRMAGGLEPFTYREADPAGDPDFDSVTSLLHFNGEEGSTLFKDTKNNRWTPSGNIKITGLYKKFGNGSGACDGSGDYISASSSAGFGMGTGDFTIEGYAQRPAAGSGKFYVVDTGTGSNTRLSILFGDGAGANNNKLVVFSDSTEVVAQTGTLPADTMFHWAVVRDGANMRIYINGVGEGSAANSSDFTEPSPMRIGADYTGAHGFNGYLDSLRVTKGVCRYPDGTTFTPPAYPFSDQAESGLPG